MELSDKTKEMLAGVTVFGGMGAFVLAVSLGIASGIGRNLLENKLLDQIPNQTDRQAVFMAAVHPRHPISCSSLTEKTQETCHGIYDELHKGSFLEREARNIKFLVNPEIVNPEIQ